MDQSTLTRHFRHLLRDSMNESDIELGTPFDEVAAYMAEKAQELATCTDEHAFDAALRLARDDVGRLAGLHVEGEPDDDDCMLGAIQGALAIGARAI